MLLPDPSIDPAALGALVREEFGEFGGGPAFVPVGGDSWNFRAGPWWVSVRRDRQGHVPASSGAARELADRGHGYALAPVRGRSGHIVFDIGGRPVVVFAYVGGTTSFPRGLSEAQHSALVEAVQRLHAARVGATVPREDFELFFGSELDGGLARAESAVGMGPLGPKVGALVRRNRTRIQQWREEIDACRDRCRRDSAPFVLTHGEPAPPNVMVTDAGDLLLLDWGDLMWAPPERDARGLAEVGVVRQGRQHVERFYELRWILGEIAEYVGRLTREHTGSAEDLEKWRELGRYLS